MMPKITIISEKCQRCGTCTQVCPETIFVQKDKKRCPETTHEHLCFACGHCVAFCPAGAIVHADCPDGRIISYEKNTWPSGQQVLDWLKTRRSIRAFQNRPVPQAEIEQVLDAAHYAPSGHNCQSTAYIVVQDREKLRQIVTFTAEYLAATVKQLRNPAIRAMLLMVAKHEIQAALASLEDFERIVQEVKQNRDSVLFHAPALLVFHSAKNAIFAECNAQLALYNAALACHGLGLGSFIAGYVMAACKRDRRIPQLLSVPEHHQIWGTLAIGYPKFTYQHWIERRPAQIA